ncbi:hypothetical protein [Acinetobacter courvalinii]|uniref:hypothetical protein n=1 Tax=Acinetobacter courvalinii TaxID=280147 RepID=UPI001900D986|nr:hypothetical protein [Acinetobacter courvalinii]MBJ8417515.1 hypothetical protein [Acinetobacter courvalinii]
MSKLDKGTLALSFKFDCDRFLRFRLANDYEKTTLGIEAIHEKRRPGIKLIADAGKRWEANKYEDIVAAYGDDRVVFNKGEWDESLEIFKFNPVPNLFEILKKENPPKIIIEGEFKVPTSITPSLEIAYKDFGLKEVKARPDILWIQPTQFDTPLIGNFKKTPKYEIHIIDVKMAAEPTLRHFTEVTYYALALSKALEDAGLNENYAVVAEGKIWPGSHDINDFKNKVRNFKARSEDDPIKKALNETLKPVPYEVYEIHVKNFLEHKLLEILKTNLNDVSWHVNNKCQLCDYIDYCEKQAEESDHLSRLAWLNQGQAETLRSNNIFTVSDLEESIKSKDSKWLSAIKNSHQLRADSLAILARAQALKNNEPVSISGRKSALMPSWTNQSIYITVHFDPGTGITFALGATKVYFASNHAKGTPPQKEEKLFIIDRVNDLTNPATEKSRLLEFASVIRNWIIYISENNRKQKIKETSHFYFWNTLELRQLKRMFERHINDPNIGDILEELIRFFPPDNQQLHDPDAFKSQPGTIVKDALRTLVGVPVAHDYSIFEVANNFYPSQDANGKKFTYKLPFGFSTPMSDQIPFERAYELWQDKIMLKHYDPTIEPAKWLSYSQDELREGIRKAIKAHLDALQHIVLNLQRHFKGKLLLNKDGFSAARSVQNQVPQVARNLITFEKLNVASQEIENRNLRSLPPEEREARFTSIRGLKLLDCDISSTLINSFCIEQPKYKNKKLYAFEFSKTSRDAKIKEGDFLLALSNEDVELNFDRKIMSVLGGFNNTKEVLLEYGIDKKAINWLPQRNLDALVQVTVLRLDTLKESPIIILKPNDEVFFQFAIDYKFIDLSRSLILDPVFADFTSKKVLNTFKTIGGKSGKVSRKSKKR